MSPPNITFLASLLLTTLFLTSCALHTRTPTIAVGQPAPEFALPDPDGKVWELAAMVADGPAVVVFYRGYW